MKTCKIFLSLLTFFLFIGGLVIIFTSSQIFEFIINYSKVLRPDTNIFNLWQKLPVDCPTEFYFFNWTNPEEINNKSTKPQFVQVGPCRFFERRENIDIVWNQNETITYRHKRFWFFDETSCDLDTNITSVNPVALSCVHLARTWPYLVKKGLSLSLSAMAPRIHMTRTIRELLFEGYSDPFISIARNMPFLVDSSFPFQDKFSWFYNRNGTTNFDGIFTMGTGPGTKLGKLYRWNHWDHSPYYKDKCAEFDGSSGEFLEPYNDHINIFSPDICRTISLKLVDQSEIEGIKGLKFVLEEQMLDNGTLSEENKCSCNGDCVPSGVFNISSCRFGTPAFISLPHFYKADEYYPNLVEGLKGEKDKHEFTVILEPVTKVSLEFKARLQLNLLLQPVADIALYEKVPKVFFPITWFEQRMQLPENERSRLKLLLRVPLMCSFFGLFMTFVSILILFLFNFRQIISKTTYIPLALKNKK